MISRERNLHAQLPLGPIRVQAVCRAHRGDMVYLGCRHGNFKIAATSKGTLVLEKEGLKVVPTEEIHGDLHVFVACQKPRRKRQPKTPPESF